MGLAALTLISVSGEAIAAPALVDQTNQLGDSLRAALLGKIACQNRFSTGHALGTAAAELQRGAGRSYLQPAAAAGEVQYLQALMKQSPGPKYFKPADLGSYQGAVTAIKNAFAQAEAEAKSPAKFDQDLKEGLLAAQTLQHILGTLVTQAEQCQADIPDPNERVACDLILSATGAKSAGLADLVSKAQAARTQFDCRPGGPADARVWYQACRVVKLSVKITDADTQSQADDNPYVDPPAGPDVGEYACKVTRDIAEGIVSPLADTTHVLTNLSEWSPVERAVLARIAQRQARFISKKGDNTMAQRVMTNLLTLAMDKISRADEKTGCRGIKHVDLGF
jgi:hypothetical protein